MRYTSHSLCDGRTTKDGDNWRRSWHQAETPFGVCPKNRWYTKHVPFPCGMTPDLIIVFKCKKQQTVQYHEYESLWLALNKKTSRAKNVHFNKERPAPAVSVHHVATSADVCSLWNVAVHKQWVDWWHFRPGMTVFSHYGRPALRKTNK